MAWIRSHKKSSGGGGGGVSILYGLLEPVSSQGDNGQIYLRTLAVGEDLSTGFTDKVGNRMTITHYANDINTYWNSSSTQSTDRNRAETYKQIDLTNIDEIQFSLYMGNRVWGQDVSTRHIRVYIENTIDPSVNWLSDSGLTPDGEVAELNKKGVFTVDVSNYTGNYWLVISSSGCDSDFKGLVIDGSASYDVEDTKLKVNGSWQSLIGSDIDDINLGN